jgi:hypothetical protein
MSTYAPVAVLNCEEYVARAIMRQGKNIGE